MPQRSSESSLPKIAHCADSADISLPAGMLDRGRYSEDEPLHVTCSIARSLSNKEHFKLVRRAPLVIPIT